MLGLLFLNTWKDLFMEYKEAKNHIKNQTIEQMIESAGQTTGYTFLEQALTDKDKSVRLNTIQFMGEKILTQSLGNLIPFLGERDRDIQEATIKTLSKMGALAVVSLIWSLETPDLQRNNAASVLLEIGPQIIQDILDQTRASNVGSSFHLATFLELYHPDEDIRQSGINISSPLLSAGISPLVMKDTANKIFNSLRDNDPNVRARGARMIGRLGVSPDLSIVNLTKLLDDESEQVQIAALGSLAMFGESRTLPFFEKKTQSKSANVRKATATGLGKIYNADSAKILVPLYLSDNKSGVIEAADISLQRLGEHALPALIQSLSQGNPRSVEIITKIGRSSIPQLIEALESKSMETINLTYKILIEFADDSIINIQEKVQNEVSQIFVRNLLPLLPKLPGEVPIHIVWFKLISKGSVKQIIETITEFGERSISYLVKMISNLEPNLIEPTCEVLSKLPLEITVEPLIMGFSSITEPETEIVIKFLKAIGEKSVLNRLKELAKENPEEAKILLLGICGVKEFEKLCTKGRKALKMK